MTEKKMSIEARKELYEIGVHFVASLAETQAQAAYKTLQDNLSKKADIVTVGDLDLIDLAYTMVTTIDRKNERFDSAYFGTITFTSTPDQIAAFDSKLTQDENVLRHIIIKTVPDAAEALEKCRELVQEEVKDDESEDDDDSEDSKPSPKEDDTEEEKSESDDIDQKIEEIVS